MVELLRGGNPPGLKVGCCRERGVGTSPRPESLVVVLLLGVIPDAIRLEKMPPACKAWDARGCWRPQSTAVLVLQRAGSGEKIMDIGTPAGIVVS